MHNNNIKLLNKTNFGIVKSLENMQEAMALIIEILRIVGRSVVKFKFIYASSYVARISLFNKN